VIGHVGTRVGALVDGQLPAAEAERLWSHVHHCPACRALVEREGWVKTQLAGLALTCPPPIAPKDLRGTLARVCRGVPSYADAAYADPAAPLGLQQGERRRMLTYAGVGAGSIGVAMLGVVALSFPAEAPNVDRRGVTTSFTQSTPSPSPSTTPVRTTPAAPPWHRAGVGNDERE
jgi:anti-sigma factor RsiW